MSRQDPQMKIRLPASLQRLIQETATANKRSMNAEILDRLERSFLEERGGYDLQSEFIRTHVETMARINGRSLEDEISKRLEQTIWAEVVEDSMQNLVKELNERLARIEARLEQK